LASIEADTIPKLDLSRYGWGVEITYAVDPGQNAFKGFYLASLNALLAKSPEPYLLPSQIIGRHLPEIMDQIQTRNPVAGGQPGSQ
ncbi:MAG: hypothetical protein QF717_16660, partial [SAR202 cluster bacterium]|nr:hypothetical protein [SAR202 cluster bacterium]